MRQREREKREKEGGGGRRKTLPYFPQGTVEIRAGQFYCTFLGNDLASKTGLARNVGREEKPKIQFQQVKT